MAEHMAEPTAALTFRDFAAAIMRGDPAASASVLQTLLALTPERAALASEHFRRGMASPSFMPKAMGLRTVVTTGSDAEIASLLTDCFGLEGAEQVQALAALRERYPAGPQG